MKRSRLKNIINKSKDLSNPIGAFDKFKKSLPVEIDNDYRLEAAWKAYGLPKDYKAALWEGLVQPIDETTFKLPSIGYNKETEEYEYLNKGRDNELVNKDLRVWDNDVIPFVLELKQGGYIKSFDEEKDCWIYTKNSQKLPIEEFKAGGKKKIKIKTHEDTYIELDSLTEDLKLGRTPVGKNSKGLDLYLGGDGIAAPLNRIPGMKNGGEVSEQEQSLWLLLGGKYKNGLVCTTKDCAAFSNLELRDSDYIVSGNAWNLKGPKLLYNGYITQNYPLLYDLAEVEEYNAQAADNFYKNFDSNSLDKNSVYAVNMYYTGSHAQEEAYKNGRDKMTGTHTGYVAWNPDTNRWEVTHNIYGTIHVDPFTKILGRNKKYGITGIFELRKNNLMNKLATILGFGEGGTIETFLEGGKPKKVKSDLSYYDPETDTIYYSGEKRKDRKEAYKHEYVHSRPDEYSELFDYLKPYYENLNDDKISELGGNLEFVKRFNGDPNHFYNPEELVARMVAASYRTRNIPEYSEEFFENLRLNENKYGDNMRDLLHMYNNKNLSLMFKYFRKPVSGGFGGVGFYQDPNGEIGDGMSLKPTGEYAPDGLEYYISPSGDRYTLQPQAFKQGGQLNVIPEGALHAHKNHMELAEKGQVTPKGVPVIDKEGVLQAEVEREEWTMTKELTDDVEAWYKEYYKEDTPLKRKDELAIKCGKRITEELLHNTDDRTNLISKLSEEEE